MLNRVIWNDDDPASGGALPDHLHDLAGDGGATLNPDIVTVASSFSSVAANTLGGELDLQLGRASLASGTYNDLSLSGTFLGQFLIYGLTPTGGNIICTGIAVGSYSLGATCILYNDALIGSGLLLTLNENDTASLATSRIRTGVGNITLIPGQGVILFRTNNRWEAIGLTTDLGTATPAAINKTPIAGTSINGSHEDHSHSVIGNQVQTVRGLTTGAIAASAVATVTVTWATTFTDTNYTVIATAGLNNTNAPPTWKIGTKTATTVTIIVKNNHTASQTFTLDVVGIHD